MSVIKHTMMSDPSPLKIKHAPFEGRMSYDTMEYGGFSTSDTFVNKDRHDRQFFLIVCVLC